MCWVLKSLLPLGQCCDQVTFPHLKPEKKNDPFLCWWRFSSQNCQTIFSLSLSLLIFPQNLSRLVLMMWNIARIEFFFGHCYFHCHCQCFSSKACVVLVIVFVVVVVRCKGLDPDVSGFLFCLIRLTNDVVQLLHKSPPTINGIFFTFFQ